MAGWVLLGKGGKMNQVGSTDLEITLMRNTWFPDLLGHWSLPTISKLRFLARCHWLMPVFLAMWEGEMRNLQFEANPGKFSRPLLNQ
jgi:hypothetical protein